MHSPIVVRPHPQKGLLHTLTPHNEQEEHVGGVKVSSLWIVAKDNTYMLLSNMPATLNVRFLKIEQNRKHLLIYIQHKLHVHITSQILHVPVLKTISQS